MSHVSIPPPFVARNWAPKSARNFPKMFIKNKKSTQNTIDTQAQKGRKLKMPKTQKSMDLKSEKAKIPKSTLKKIFDRRRPIFGDSWAQYLVTGRNQILGFFCP